MRISDLRDRMMSLNWGRSLLRPTLAYLLASLSAGLVLEGSMPRSSTFLDSIVRVAVLAGYAAVLAFVPVALAILVIRAAKLPRGLSEIVAGAVCAVLSMCLLVFLLGGAPPPPTNAAFWQPLPPLTLAGAVAGLVYWLANGRPRR